MRYLTREMRYAARNLVEVPVCGLGVDGLLCRVDLGMERSCLEHVAVRFRTGSQGRSGSGRRR